MAGDAMLYALSCTGGGSAPLFELPERFPPPGCCMVLSEVDCGQKVHKSCKAPRALFLDSESVLLIDQERMAIIMLFLVWVRIAFGSLLNN